MKTQSTRDHYKSVMRAYRLAHKTDIMSEFGCVIRRQAASQVREFTGKWDIPRPLWLSALSTGYQRQRTQYKPSAAFSRFLKVS